MSFITFPARIEGAQYKNTSIGYDALYRVTPAPPDGEDNTAFGYAALQLNTTGESNTAIGSQALGFNITGRRNTAIGESALQNNESGEFNVAVGTSALDNSDSDYNVSIGANSLLNYNGAGFNTAVGAGAGQLITTGSKNTILGRYNGNQGGLDIRTASNYCVISDGDGNPRIIVDPTGLVSAPGGFSGGGGGGGAITIDNKISAYNIVSADLGKVINCTTNTFTISMDGAGVLGAGFNCWVWNTGNGIITINPNGAELIDGRSTLTLSGGEGMQIICDGVNWQTGDKKTMRGYAEFVQSASSRPSATGAGCIAIGVGAQSAGGDALAFGTLSIAGNSNAIAIGTSTQANPSYSAAIGSNSAGSGSQTASSFGSMALGGSYASGSDSFAAAISTNSSLRGANALGAIAIGNQARGQATGTIALGTQSLAAGSSSVAIGGASSNGARSFAWGVPFLGSAAIAGGAEAVAFGESCQALQQRSFAYGHGSKSNTYGKFAYACGFFAVAGDNQYGRTTLRSDTTTATPEVMTTNNGFGSSTNQLNLSDNFSAIAFEGLVVARRQGTSGTETAAWKIEGLARREVGVATTTLITSTVTVISNAPGWGLALSADTVNGAVAITVTGAAINIRWSATVHASEVTYS